MLENLDLHRQVHRANAISALEDHLIEEMSELTQKILQRRRGRPITRNDFVEEVVDVDVCMAYLKHYNNIGETEFTKMLQIKQMKMKAQLEKKLRERFNDER